MTIAAAAAGRPTDRFERVGFAIRVTEQIPLAPPLQSWLQRLTAPHLDDRTLTATDALAGFNRALAEVESLRRNVNVKQHTYLRVDEEGRTEIFYPVSRWRARGVGLALGFNNVVLWTVGLIVLVAVLSVFGATAERIATLAASWLALGLVALLFTARMRQGRVYRDRDELWIREPHLKRVFPIRAIATIASSKDEAGSSYLTLVLHTGEWVAFARDTPKNEQPLLQRLACLQAGAVAPSVTKTKTMYRFIPREGKHTEAHDSRFGRDHRESPRASRHRRWEQA